MVTAIYQTSNFTRQERLIEAFIDRTSGPTKSDWQMVGNKLIVSLHSSEVAVFQQVASELGARVTYQNEEE